MATADVHQPQDPIDEAPPNPTTVAIDSIDPPKKVYNIFNIQAKPLPHSQHEGDDTPMITQAQSDELDTPVTLERGGTGGLAVATKGEAAEDYHYQCSGPGNDELTQVSPPPQPEPPQATIETMGAPPGDEASTDSVGPLVDSIRMTNTDKGVLDDSSEDDLFDCAMYGTT